MAGEASDAATIDNEPRARAYENALDLSYPLTFTGRGRAQIGHPDVYANIALGAMQLLRETLRP